ncbi:MAG: hypothetical protein E6J59_17135 [Deltaproteobacteria bacterium]|nr:MAG: hypothetical protein E6J59_17135 [Deltaproteobacteria bacterium]
MMSSRGRLGWGLLALAVWAGGPAPVRADLDISGTWNVCIVCDTHLLCQDGLDTWTVTQADTTLTLVVAGGLATLTGVIDPSTGVFDASLVEGDLSVMGVATPGSLSGRFQFLEDGSFSGLRACDIAAPEACDDGRRCTADSCSEIPLSICGTTVSCTYHTLPGCCEADADCEDGNPCTIDRCDAAGQCSHAPGNAGAVCRPAAGACDVAESCDGVSPDCPTDITRPDGTRCDDGNSCTRRDRCRSGMCAGICKPSKACASTCGAPLP